VGDEFRPHYDWFSTTDNPRVSTFFVYLDCKNCEGGATQFPRIEGKFSAKWCDWVDCSGSEDSEEVGGVGFKPVSGNAVYWAQQYPNGTYHPGTWHAGMPIRKGTKYGMNIMTRQYPY
jgi:prolyl 4-hydroxylase